MAPVLSFPFRVDPVTRTGKPISDGPDHDPVLVGPRQVVAVDPGSDHEIAEAIAAHIMVAPSERPMRPDFGTVPMPFGPGLSATFLQLQLLEHGWEHVAVRRVEPADPEGNYRRFSVSWERAV